MITDSQIFVALFAALITGILAARLGIELARPAAR
jgi:photosystem I reaction center subunit XII